MGGWASSSRQSNILQPDGCIDGGRPPMRRTKVGLCGAWVTGSSSSSLSRVPALSRFMEVE